MQKYHKNAVAMISGTIMSLLLGGLSSCGGGGGGKSGGTPTKRQSDAPRPEGAYFLTLADGSPQQLTFNDKPVLWSYNLTVDAEQRGSAENIAFDELRHALEQEKVSGVSRVELSLTLREAEGLSVLATNVADAAVESEMNQALWTSGCQSVDTNVSLMTDGRILEKNDRQYLQLTMELCDFANILVSPTITIKSAQRKSDPRNVVFECKAGNYNGFYSTGHLLYMNNPYHSTCEAGYTNPNAAALVTSRPMLDRDGNAKQIEVPEGFVNEAFRLDTGNDFIDFDRHAAVSKRFSLEENKLDAFALPLGKSSDCHTLEIEMRYKDQESTAAGTTKESRLVFKRELDSVSGQLKWISDDQTILPSAEAIHAAAQSTNRFWLHCTWHNETGLDISHIPASQ